MVLSPIFVVAGVSYDSWDGYWVPGLVSRLQSPGSQVPGVTYEIGPGSRVSGPTYRVRVSGPGSQPRMGPGYQVSGLTKSVYVYKKKKKKKKILYLPVRLHDTWYGGDISYSLHFGAKVFYLKLVLTQRAT